MWPRITVAAQKAKSDDLFTVQRNGKVKGI
jgi:hypothetical protein